MTLEAELAEMLLAIRDSAGPLRYGLILKALALAWMCDYEAGLRVDPEAPQWLVAFIGLPTGQVAWHVPQYRTPHDGHTAEEKYRRIAEFAKSV